VAPQPFVADGSPVEPPPPRKGARTIAAIPPAILRELNAGRDETRTLVEWLAVDPAELWRAVAGEAGLPTDEKVLAELRELANAKAMARMRGIGALVERVLRGREDREAVLRRLSLHRSDVVRAWACYATVAPPRRTLNGLLSKIAPFACDPNMAVRECAWEALRPRVLADLPAAIELYRPWTARKETGLRRCAVEGTRPRGVWTAHAKELIADPEPGLVLLEPLKADPERYVQDSVANWLNDASKSEPDWVRDVCRRWLRESDSKATAYIAKRAQRSLSD
jgi:3-methyladenine DNA glycosylase AlkC